MKRSLKLIVLFFAAPLCAQANPNAVSPSDVAKRASQEWPVPDVVRGPVVPWSPCVEDDGTLRLNLGPLMNVVQDIDGLVKELQAHNESTAEWEMPNLVWGDVGDHFVGSHLVLRRVTPLQAVTLAAAAADCHLEPIYGPERVADEGTEPAVRAIIGYKVEPGREAARSGSVRGGKGYGSEPLSLPQVGKTTQATRQEAAMDPSQPDVVAVQNPSELPEPVATHPAADADALFTRVYSLGGALSAAPKTDEEAKARASKLDEIQSLITQALEMGGFSEKDGSMKGLKMAVHEGSGAFVVRGTEAQQDLIEQAIEALRRSQGWQ